MNAVLGIAEALILALLLIALASGIGMLAGKTSRYKDKK